MSILELVMAETIFRLLCGLEGTGSLGSVQRQYKLFDEDGNELTQELDALFFERVDALSAT